MADVLNGVRQKLQQISESGRAVGRLASSGIIDLKDLRSDGPGRQARARLRTTGDDGDHGREQVWRPCLRSSTNAGR